MKQPPRTKAPNVGPSRSRPWFALVGAPSAWILHLLACYAWVGIVCVSGISRGVLAAGLIGVTLPLAAAAAAAGWVAWRSIEAHGRPLLELMAEPPDGRTGLPGAVGIVLAGLFVPLILLEAAQALIAPLCAAGGSP